MADNPNIPIEQYDRKTEKLIINPKTGLPKRAKPTTATAYCWIIWEKDHKGPRSSTGSRYGASTRARGRL